MSWIEKLQTRSATTTATVACSSITHWKSLKPNLSVCTTSGIFVWTRDGHFNCVVTQLSLHWTAESFHLRSYPSFCRSESATADFSKVFLIGIMKPQQQHRSPPRSRTIMQNCLHCTAVNFIKVQCSGLDQNLLQ